MNDNIQPENTIILDGRVSLDDYKIYWRDQFFKELPNTIIFWGTLAVGALLVGILFRDNFLGLFFLFLSFLAVAIPVSVIIFSYQSFMTASRKYVDSLSETDRHYNLIIKPDGNGIECLDGENFSFISWNSIRNVFEREQYFSLEFRANPFLIMKREFADESDIRLFRKTLADKLGANAKLLR